MREIISILLLVILISVSFSAINATDVHNLLTNCTLAANKNIGDYHTWIDCLNRTSFVLNGSYNYSKSGVLFLRGYNTYLFEVYNGSKKIHSNSTNQTVYLLPSGNYTIKVSSSGYLPDTIKVKLTPGYFEYLYFELEKNTTNSSKSNKKSGGLLSNTFVKISNTYLKMELESLKDILNLSDEQIQYQKKVLDYTKVSIKYYLFTTQNANTLYYYVYNNWNKTVNLTIVVEIPKDISKDLNGVSLKTNYKIIKSDPIVSWNLKIDSGKSAYVEYTVANKNITSITPPVLLFSGINLPVNNTSNNTVNQQNITQNNLNITQNNQTQNNTSNQTQNLIKHKNNFNYLHLILLIVVIVLSIVGIYLYLFRKRPHQLIEESIQKIEDFIE